MQFLTNIAKKDRTGQGKGKKKDRTGQGTGIKKERRGQETGIKQDRTGQGTGIKKDRTGQGEHLTMGYDRTYVNAENSTKTATKDRT